MNDAIFNDDELRAQSLAGGGSPGTGIRPVMVEQHRTFFAMLPYLLVASLDDAGHPVAGMLTGDPGFVHAPDETQLRIDAIPDRRTPLAAVLQPGKPAGILGIDLATRRRNRANGTIVAADPRGLTIAIAQSFGNCPQYIQRRSVEHAADAPGHAETLAGLDAEARHAIEHADTFFVASRSRELGDANDGVDISHRGGRPGFVSVEGDTLSIPDFRGNRYFNTLGNLLGDPRSALLFVDFERGDVLHLQGVADIDWSDDVARAVEGAERVWRFHVRSAWRGVSVVPLRWRFIDQSPMTTRTGIWKTSAPG